MKRLYFVFGIGAAGMFVACQGIIGFGDERHLLPDGAPDATADAPYDGGGGDDVTTTPDAKGDAPIDASTDAPDAPADAISDGASNDGLDASDADRDADASVDAAPACPTNASDFYVGGASACAFTTITAALVAARQSNAPARTVHVTAGAYAAPSETFPLDLRGGISLEGLGAKPEDTVISGMGALDHSIEGGEVGSTHATIVAGAPSVVSTITNLRILSGEDVARSQGLGIFCDRGNAVAPPATQPAPNLVVDRLIVEHGYSVGIRISNTTYPKSGCNARITSTAFNAAWNAFSYYGVIVGGCDATASSARTALVLGDGTTAHANTFEDIGKGDGSAGAVAISQCAASVIVQGNNFNTGEAGVFVNTPASDAQITITGNTFTHQANGGIRVWGSSKIDEITGNTFTECAYGGIWVESGSAQILRARKNVFVGNETGVSIENDPITGTFDFGTPSSLGGNEFRCNAAQGQGNLGYDFGQLVEAKLGALVTAYGNAWDHLPVSSSTSMTNGEDVVLPPSGPLPDIGGGTLATSACPSGQVPGP